MINRGWIYHPALRHALPFGCGTGLVGLFNPSAEPVIFAMAVTLIICAMPIRSERGEGLAPALAAVVLLAGILHAIPRQSLFEPFEGTLLRRADIVGRVISDPIVRNGRLEIVVSCDSIIYRSMAFRPATRILVSIGDTVGVARSEIAAGDHISAVGSLAVPAAPHAPWEPDMRGYLRSRGIGLTANVRSAGMLYLFDRGDLSPLEHLVATCRRTAREFGASMVTGEEGDIVVSLLTGERSGLDAETRDAFLETGTIHVLAVSGLHVGLIALVLGVGLSWIPSRGAQLPLFLLAIFLYVAIVGGGPSIVRAAVMGGAFMGARLAGRISRPINTLAFSALVVLLIDPMQIHDIGFQLSFGSVAGIILFAGALRSRAPVAVEPGAIRTAARWLGDALWLSFSAQIFTLPILLHHFGALPTTSLPANLLVVPLTTAALGSALAGSLLLPLIPAAAEWFGASAYLATTAALGIVRWTAALPPGSIEFATISSAAMIVLLVGLLPVALAGDRSRFLFRGGVWLLLLVMTIAAGRRLDPLGETAGRFLYWYRSAEGSDVAVMRGDTVTIYTEKVRASGPGEERLRRWTGADAVAILQLDSTYKQSIGDELMRVNDLPGEYLLDPPGVILSASRQPLPGLRRVEGATLLRLPLGRRPAEAIIFHHGDREWEVARWR